MRTKKKNILESMSACVAYNEVLAFILVDPFQDFFSRVVQGGDILYYGTHWTYENFKQHWNPLLFPAYRLEDILTPMGFTPLSWGVGRGRWCIFDELD